ncbi:PREDICTED: uncharacterized protein LOC104600751 isoform X2 [Nelumbo nucifera]|uniref:Uncharacterized protein LOC104600751 isoform X2 n=1 Tax=Nelumbo nucifera TaxID=4432 RepID=A0A1U8A4U8_NELNU|nr:PREDICTED: uncharacterized protein LOC104600751 isoform X2 [Nelumbo nucifera]
MLLYPIPLLLPLPKTDVVQSRILSFLTVESSRFCKRDLATLATNILKSNQRLDFWVKKAAHNLLDAVSSSTSSIKVTDEVEDEFEALPHWLQNMTSKTNSILPWFPLSPDMLNSKSPVCSFADRKADEDSIIDTNEVEMEELNQVAAEIKTVDLVDMPLHPEIQNKATCIKTQLLTFESTSKIVGLANEIRQLCFESGGGDYLPLLGLIEPWQTDDEIASILITHLSCGSEEKITWPSHVLCSVILPKLLVLREPASRVLVTATVEYCKLHQKAAVDGLLFPLILCKEGISIHICEVLTRIIKECLHPAHVSAFCQKLLCGEEEPKKFMCLPCHQCLVSNELVWTEPLFTLFQNILNQNVYLTQDSVDYLVSGIGELAKRFSKSLKFANFLLCLITKCAPLLKSHRVSLSEAVGQTNTFMTKSILAKLSSL